MGLGLVDVSTAQVHSSYPPLAVAVAIMGAGMGLVMAPASTAIMNSVPSHQAGAGSAVNDTIREVGGALGIAVIGSISAAAYSTRLGTTLAAAHAPGSVTHIATGSVAAADALSLRAGGAAGLQLAATAHAAFVHAMSVGLRVAAAVALASALAAVFALPRRPRRSPAAPDSAALALAPAAQPSRTQPQTVVPVS